MNFLKKIIEVKKNEVRKLRSDFSPNDFKDSEFYERPARGLIKNVKSRSRKNEQLMPDQIHQQTKQLSIIAEIKKASPSKGVISENFNHLEIAKAYFECAPQGISVLTDNFFFMGSAEYLKDISRISPEPILRKDFIIDEIQIFESKSIGADAILLIAEILSKSQIEELTLSASELGLDILLELHSEEQLEKIDFSLNKMIGINNRNLETFKVDLNTTSVILKNIPRETVIISESGISTKEDVEFIKNSGVDGMLVGESIMRSNDIKNRLMELQSWT